MEVERAGGLEDAVEGEEARGHHDEIGRHVVAPEKGDEGVHHLRHVGVRLVGEGGEFGLGLVRPVPGVLEGFDLRLAGVALGGLEEEVVVALGIKGRVEVDEVHGFGGDAVAQDVEVVAVVEVVHPASGVSAELRDGEGGVHRE